MALPLLATQPAQAAAGPAQAPRVILQRAPLAPLALAVVAGVVAARYLSLPPGVWAVLAAGGFAVAVVAAFRQHLHLAACAGAIVAATGLAALYTWWVCFTIPANHIVTYTQPSPIIADVSGQVVTWPQIVKDDPSLRLPYSRPERTVFLLEAQQIDADGGPTTVTGLVRVTVDEPCSELRVGQHVKLLCKLGRYNPARNPGQPDPAQIAREKRVLAWATVPAAEGVIVQGPAMNWHKQWYWRLRAATREHLATTGPQDDAQLVNALILGERHPALQKLNQAMMRAGVAHYLSISGSHLAIFLGFVYMLCRVTSLSPRRASVAVLVVLAAYLLLAEASAPLFRSGIMAGSLALAGLSGRRHSGLNALAAATIILLAVDPMDLFSAGFQLSFGLVLGMLLLSGPIKRRLFSRYLRRRGLMVFRNEQRWRRFLHHRVTNWLMDGLAISLAAYVVSVPLVAYHFGVFSPYAGVLSLLLVAPMTLVLVPGYISMALLWPMPSLSYAIGQVACQAADALEACVAWMQGLPGLCLDLHPMPAAWAAMCFVAVALALWAWRSMLCKAAVAATLLALGGWMFVCQQPASAPPSTRVHVLSVGAGQCVLLHSPSGKTYLFDAGTRSGFDSYRSVLGPFLRHQKLPAPHVIVVSHANADHFSGVFELAQRRKPARFLCSPYFSNEYGPGAAELLEVLASYRVTIERLVEGTEIKLDDHVTVQVLWPRPQLEKKTTVNDTSLVLKIVCDGSSILLPADAESAAQAALLDAKADLKSDVLVLPHHGSWSQTLPEFVAAVNPKLTIASGSFDPAVGKKDQPEKFYRSLAQQGMLSTWKNGYVCIGLGYGKVSQLSPAPAATRK